jgi:hypothetical protein
VNQIEILPLLTLNKIKLCYIVSNALCSWFLKTLLNGKRHRLDRQQQNSNTSTGRGEALQRGDPSQSQNPTATCRIGVGIGEGSGDLAGQGDFFPGWADARES